MEYQSVRELVTAYLEEHLRGKASYKRSKWLAAKWLLTLPTTPTRPQCLARHLQTGHGHYQPGATVANHELDLLRSACRWGLYQERWDGGDPTLGIKKWKRHKRKRIGKYDEIRVLMTRFAHFRTRTDLRDRALFGLEFLTGCRQGEARTALLGAITPYGSMGCWQKPTTKTGAPHEIPVPLQAMAWLQAWLTVRPLHDPRGTNPYLFPGQLADRPLGAQAVRRRWAALCHELGIHGLWNYDLRRTMASYLGNALHYDDTIIQAVLNHADGRALSHYYHVSFDALTLVVQKYADWLCMVKDDPTADAQRSEAARAPQVNGHPARPVVEVREGWHEYPG